MATTLIKNGYLLDPLLPFERGDILIEDDLITRVSSNIDSPADTVINASNKVVLPGLINAHTHTFSLPFRGLTGNLPLDGFLLYIDYAVLEYDISPRELYVFNILGAIELLKTGTTSLLETGPPVIPDEFEKMADATIAAFRDAGIRAVINPMYEDLNYSETLPLHLIGDLKQEEIASLNLKSPSRADELIQALRNYIKSRRDGNPRLSFSLGAHSPNRCSPELMGQTVELAAELELGIHVHLLEAKFQVIICNKMFKQPTVDYLASINCLGPHVSFAHGVWLDERDIQILAETGSSIVHNPVGNMRRGDGIAPLQLMKTLGLNVALGTDSAANNDSENMFEVMKYTALMHKLYGPPSEWPGSQDAFEMCLNGGARVLQKKIGSLQPGYFADLVILSTDRLFVIPKEYFIDQLIYGNLGTSVETVLVGGRVVIDDGEVKAVDEKELYVEARESVTKLYERIPAVNKRFTRAKALLERLDMAVAEHELPFCRLAKM